MESFLPDFTEPWPSLILGTGLIFGLVLLGELVVVLVTGEAPQAFYIGIATSTPGIIGFVYGGYRLARSDLPPERYGSVGRWWVVGMVGATLIIFVINATLRPITAKMAIETIRWSAAIGGCVGLIIGAFEARAVQQSVEAEQIRMRKQQIKRERDRLDKFASVISHDLQNPLHEAQGYLELAREEGEEEHLDAVEDAQGRMSMLIEDILELAREGASATDFEPVDLDRVVKVAWEAVGTEESSLVVSSDATIVANEGSLRHLLENLIKNAIEHGGGAVTVTVGNTDEGFYVAADGPGISAEAAERVFDPSYSTSDDGTRFGLYIVEQVVMANGWDIAVSESSEGGARFDISGVAFAD